MKRKNATRSALMMSVLSLLVCVSMLVGTTFAWFTDSVTSANNIIKSGNLDVEMFWADGTKAVPTTEDGWTDASKGAIFDYSLWEPGYTEVRHIKIANKGTLALKYQLMIKANGEVSDLADVIDVYFIDPATQVASRNELTDSNKVDTLSEILAGMPQNASGSLAAGENATVTLALKMKETAGNEYMNKEIGTDFSVILFATQVEAEEDSFGKDYDVEAGMPGVSENTVPGGNATAVSGEVRDENGAKIATYEIPKTAIASEAEKVKVDVKKTETNTNVTVGTGNEAQTFEVKVTGLKENNDVPVKVKLRIDANLDPATVKLYHYAEEIPCTYDPETGYVTFESTTFSPFTVVYDAESVYVPPVEEESKLPQAKVVESPEYVNVDLPWGSYGQWSPTPGLEANLEAAYTFSCVETLEDAKLNPYANWYCDFYVKLDKPLGENEIFLGGNYGSFGWVGFHNGDLTLAANTEIGLLESVTTNPWTYLDVVQNVGTFICGVGDVDDALAGATFTVMLRLTNPENENEFYNVSTINYTFTQTAEVASADALAAALAAGNDVVLTDDIELDSTLMATKPVVIDLNGNTITAPASDAMFQSQSNAAPNMIITSSANGAAINVAGGDTAVLLGYGSTVIENVTINVTDCDNASPNPFKAYGDLTLGEGTVVNVDYLGTALISNNGAANIVIDGAKINIGTFKTNGTAIITLNSASTLTMKNTEIKVGEFVLSSFGGDSLVSKTDDVTVENCKFDVTDSNGASCTFEAKEGKYRLVQK